MNVENPGSTHARSIPPRETLPEEGGRTIQNSVRIETRVRYRSLGVFRDSHPENRTSAQNFPKPSAVA